MSRVLIVDDEEGVSWALENLVRDLGHDPTSAATAERALELARDLAPDMVLLDVRLPGMDGLAALEEFQRIRPGVPVVLMTAHGTVDTAIQSMARGAFDFLAKPFDPREVRAVVGRALETSRAESDLATLPAPGDEDREIVELAGDSPEMREVAKRIGLVAPTSSAILVLGESGTGKELVARAIHQASPRAAFPFEPIHCAALPTELLESELYGHEKGAFTGAVRTKRGKFEIADGGTVLLDEVAEIPPAVQVKLLRFLEDRTFTRVGGVDHLSADVRIVAATHRNLQAMIEEGRFREDLYYRLNVITIRVPPLRDRPGDVPVLVSRFLSRLGRREAGLTRVALAAILAHPWPGNVRELKNAIEHAAVLARGRPIDVGHLPDPVTRARPVSGLEAELDRLAAEVLRRWSVDEIRAGGVYERVMEAWERPILARAIASVHWNQVRAAEFLGIHRATLRKRLRKYGILPAGGNEDEDGAESS